MLVVVLVASFVSIVLYYVVYAFWSKEQSEDTKKFADNIAMRIGVVYSVVVGMMFANVRIEHMQMVQAIESEASALVRLHFAIAAEGGEDTEQIQKNIVAYIRYIVDEQWPPLTLQQAAAPSIRLLDAPLH